MGLTTVAVEEGGGKLILIGNPRLKRTAQQWLGFSFFAAQRKYRGTNVAMRIA